MMLHEIYPKKFRNEYKESSPQKGDFIMCFEGDSLLLLNETLPQLSCFKVTKIELDKMIYLFSIDNDAFYLYIGTLALICPELKYCNLKNYFESHISWEGFAAITAHQLYRWYQDNIYCSKCGQKAYQNNTARSIDCYCGRTIFPPLSPVVIVAIINIR